MSLSREIVMRPVASLLPAHRNARTHTKRQIQKIAKSIERFGFVMPILTDDAGRIVAGHGRLAAAKILALESVPTILANLSKDELRALAIADNEIARQAGWDKDILALEFAELKVALPELDLTVTGFEPEMVEILIDGGMLKASHREPAIPPLPKRVLTQLGDLWLIGEHRLLCGDALLAESYLRLLGSEQADIVISDPPFNVPIKGHVSSAAWQEFAMASGEMTREQFQRFLSITCERLVGASRLGSVHYLFMDWRSVQDLLSVGEAHYSELLNLIVWVKPTGGMGSLYRSRHELVAVFKNGNRSHVNRIKLGSHGRNRSNVWEYAGANGAGSDRKTAKLHPTVKNLEMIADAICDCSDPNDVVLDAFGGSGTTLVAAAQTSRRARLIEIDPAYCDVTLARAASIGLAPIHADTGKTFSQLQEERQAQESNDG